MHIDSVTEAGLIALRAMPDEIAAITLDGRLRVIDAIERRGYMEKGLIVYEVERRLLWRFLADYDGTPYTSLTQWILKAAPFGYATCMESKETVKLLLQDVPASKLADIPRCNAILMKQLSSQVRKDEGVLKAATGSRREFIATIQRDFPDQHFEDTQVIHFAPPASASPVIEQGFKLVMLHEGLTTREQVLEYWASRSIQEYEQAEAV